MTEPRDVRVFLDDILEYARSAREFTRGLTSASELSADQMRFYAVVRALEVMGEAARRVPLEVRALAPEIPWSAMVGMRDRLIHGYRNVDLDLVWTTATVHVPTAEPLVRALLARLESEAGDNPEG